MKQFFCEGRKDKPSDAGAFFNLGNLHRELGNLDKAFLHSQVLELEPDNPGS